MTPKNRKILAARVSKAATEALAARHYVTCVDVLVGIRWLDPEAVKRWRRRRAARRRRNWRPSSRRRMSARMLAIGSLPDLSQREAASENIVLVELIVAGERRPT
jgi:hypothetical protein